MKRIINEDLAAYTKENVYDFDNNIMLHAYPSMIVNRLETLWGGDCPTTLI